MLLAVKKQASGRDPGAFLLDAFAGDFYEAARFALLAPIFCGRSAMIVVMKSGSSQSQIDHVITLVREMGLKEHVIVGTERTVIAAIGNDRLKDKSKLETVEGVDKVMPVLAPYKIASREVRKDRSMVPIGSGKIAGNRIRVIAGP